jgi:hypothetical protein
MLQTLCCLLFCCCRPEQTEQRFVCSVKLPRVVLEDGGVGHEVLAEEIFQGEGRKKADAKVGSGAGERKWSA